MGDVLHCVFNCVTRETTVREMSKGDEIWVKSDGTVPKLGQQYKNYNAIVTKLDYKYRRWYEFWKKKELLGYVVTWL